MRTRLRSNLETEKNAPKRRIREGSGKGSINEDPDSVPDTVPSEDRLPTEDEIWYIIQSYIETHGLVRHQLESFNNFLYSLLPHIVQESSEIRVKQGDDEEHVISICNLSVGKPSYTRVDGTEHDVTPLVARLRSLTYSSAVLVDVVHDIFVKGKRVERRLFREVCLCRLPIMLGCRACHTSSGDGPHECTLDPGGYFIVSGCEKVLVSTEKLHHNTPYVFPVKQPSRYAFQCEIRSCHERKLRSTSSLYLYISQSKKGATPEMVVTLPFINMNVPVLALFRLLHVSSRTEAMNTIFGGGSDFSPCSETRTMSAILDNDTTADMDADALYDYIGNEGTKETTPEKKQRYIDHIINCEVLPHMGLTRTEGVLRGKALFLGMMVRKLLRVYLGEKSCDDRDHYSTKRVDCAGTQFGLLFRQVFRSVHRSISVQLYRAADANRMRSTNIGNLVAGKKLTQAFRYALATGNWGILSSKGNTAQNGIAQQLNRMTVPTTISMLRKVCTPVAKETKNPKPRQLHPTAWGLICPMDTPEGAGCGLTKSLSMLAHVRVGTYSESVLFKLNNMVEKHNATGTVVLALDATDSQRRNGIPVLVNGMLHMYTVGEDAAALLVDEIRKMRRMGSLPFDTSVARTDGNIVLDTDPGCLMRPLLRVCQLTKIPSLLSRMREGECLHDALLTAGIMEYIDKQEEASMRVAMSPLSVPGEGWANFTHCEIDPSLIVGLCGSCIPFPEFNQSPRNTYQSAMMKQAIGVYTLNNPVRMDTIAHTMTSPQRPIVTTRMDSLVGVSEAPAGVNAIVCIMCYTGQNQEDSLILNQASLDRGMFRTVKYQTYRDEEHQNGGSDQERFENVTSFPEVVGKRDADYSHLDGEGIVRVGSEVKENDVLLSKTIMTTDLGEGARKAVKRDKSTVVRHEGGIVDTVLRVRHQDGTSMVKVKVRKTRAPIVGDKLSSRMGQKGVVGLCLPQQDMPFTEDGITPDIIVNPHAIPSRMTVGQLAECLLAILCTKKGERGDGTMFRGTSLEYICDMLEREGYDRKGRTRLRNGFTGEEYESLIFLGPTYYQRLRHMAADKDHARSRGPIHMLSRQPTEGRARDGGLRFGEMERDCVISHGAAEFLRDRLLDNSDESKMTVCGLCGFPAYPAAKNTVVRHKEAHCRNCGTSGQKKVRDIRCPYAFRLLVQELQAMQVAVRFQLKDA